mmetsp:Transcript_91848/g.285687  ORF Transcript_91848/g.285687 Transcript_91848/m.285687 type:complete len:457 (+) Transcript_91848:2-1372(+)
MHRVYRRGLRLAFFANGEDKMWKQVRSNPYCPFLIVTATVNDYMRPGDSIPLSEISLSPLHVGGQKTGYIQMPPMRSLARCVALSGAAIDAFFLGKKDHVKYRFWLELLSLSMGDFLLFETNGGLRARLGRLCGRRSGPSGESMHIVYRLPALIVAETFYVLLLFANNFAMAQKCNPAAWLYFLALVVTLLSILLSLIAFLPCLDLLLHSLIIRGIHLLARFYHRADVPPSLVYVTDGGLLDNTGVMQLMRRRVRRILLVYGGNDPKDTFKWLRKVVDSAANERLASFYDPAEPGRDLRETLQRFSEDRTVPFLHLGIRYGWCSESDLRGDLFIVTNRILDAYGELWVEPLLTEAEIRGEEGPGEGPGDGRKRMKQTDLGGCCCDCCHSHGCNFGRKFPNPHNANQCLTPQLFNSLCRLGHRASQDAVQAVRAVGYRTPGPHMAPQNSGLHAQPVP